MAKDLYYEIGTDEYWIKDRNNPSFSVYQYGNYTHLFVPEGTLEENAQAQLESLSTDAEYDASNNPIYQEGYDQALLDLIEEGAL